MLYESPYSLVESFECPACAYGSVTFCSSDDAWVCDCCDFKKAATPPDQPPHLISQRRGADVKHLWEVKHPYYCTEGGYFWNQSERQTIWEFKSWADFLAEMGDADLDYNLLFRWDWSEENEETGEPTFKGDVNYRNGKLMLFFMAQRKGFHSTSIVEVCRADEPAVIEYLRPRLVHLMSLWEPLSPAQPETQEGEK